MTDGLASVRAYVFDNAGQETRRRFAGLPEVFDSGTIRHLGDRGLSAGWRCLEVGAGGGSVAAWLAERVGPTGYVLATDVDTRFLDDLKVPNLEVRRHDITTDAVPEHRFDLVHARLVLSHLRARDVALARMAAALKPDGWLVVEDVDALSVCADPGLDAGEVFLHARAAMSQVMAARGIDLLYGRRVPARMLTLGLTDVGAEGRIFRWQGGFPGTSIDCANLQQLRAPILASGQLTEPEFESELALLDDPKTVYPSPTLWATWGRRPGAC